MSTDTSIQGIVCYGVLFEEGFIFPWDKKGQPGDLEEWWESQPEEGPIPVELVYVGHEDYPTCILAVCDTVQNGFWHDPEPFQMPTREPDSSVLLQFCQKFRIKLKKKQIPRWYIGAFCNLHF